MTDQEIILAQRAASRFLEQKALSSALFKAMRQAAFDAFETAADTEEMQSAHSLLIAVNVMEMQLIHMANEAKTRTE